MRKSILFALAILGLAVVFTSSAVADTVEIAASKDNTLYEDAAGSLSNGAGSYLFVGKTVMNALRRTVIAFDVAGSVPAGATIDSVSLTLNMSMTIAGAHDVTLHRATRDWGESTSDAENEEGIGAPAERGDATWIHAVLPGTLWDDAGGDFVAAASATASVGGSGPYTWTGMTADVQAWLDDPSGNFGWVVLGDESTSPTAKRFDSRENANEGLRPALVIEFTPGSSSVPAASTWGVAVAAVTLLLAGTLVYRRRAIRAN